MYCLKPFSRLLLATVALAPLAAQAEPGDWTGFYAGIAAGAQVDRSSWKGQSTGPNNVFGVDPDTAKIDTNGTHGRVGGFAGWQMAVTPRLLAGVEGDVAGVLGSKTSKAGLPGAAYEGTTPADRISESQDIDASFRVRAGTWLQPDVLVYGTTGIALRDVELKASCPGGAGSWCGVSQSQSNSEMEVGWTAGAGVETRLAPRWSVRLDYRYADYGQIKKTWFAGSNQGVDQVSTKTDLTSHILLLGVAYHFGG